MQDDILGTDIGVYENPLGSDLILSQSGDLLLVSRDENISQAIINRLKTIIGEIEELGHPKYGSNIHDFIGRQNNQMTRERLKISVKDSLLEEKRIKEIKKIVVRPFSIVIPTVASTLDDNKNSTEFSGQNIDKNDGPDNKYKYTLNSKSQSAYLINREQISYDMVEIEINVVTIDESIPLNLTFQFHLDVVVV